MQGWKAEVLVQGDWSSNALVFATESEALGYGRDLASRWTLVADVRATAVEAEPTYEWSEAEGLGKIGDSKSFPPRRVQL